MTRTLAFVLSTLLPLTAMAQDSVKSEDPAMVRPAGDSDLSEFLWTKRPIVVFSDSPDDPRFDEQMELLSARMDELETRDVVILTDTDPDARSTLRTKLRPRGFMLVLVGKDGGVKLRKPLPWTVREITRTIDKMPMRQREEQERRGEG
ncbi:MAG: DUF4174 domain-containing protein [Sedimentitalea sp.]